MKRSAVLSILLFCAINAAHVCGASFQILAVEEPPSSYRSEGGDLEGLAVDIVRAIQKRMGNHDPIEMMPEVRALDIASRSPNVVLLGFSRIPEREDLFYWILPYMRKPWVLYARQEGDLGVHTLEDAQSLDAIGVVRKDVRELYLEQLGFSNLSRVSNHGQNVKKTLSGRIPMFAYDPAGLGYTCKKLAIAPTAFQPALVLKTSEVYLMMSRQGTPLEAREEWRDAARQLKAEGTLDRMAQQWAGRVAQEIGIRCSVVDGVLTFAP